jgi:uncharacterized sulfatase
MKSNYNIKAPPVVSWIGSGLDTTRSLVNNHAYPLMQTKNDLIDFVMGNNHLSGNNVYSLGQNLTSQDVQDNDNFNQLKYAFDKFKSKNNKIINGGALIPDSIYQKYSPR